MHFLHTQPSWFCYYGKKKKKKEMNNYAVRQTNLTAKLKKA